MCPLSMMVYDSTMTEKSIFNDYNLLVVFLHTVTKSLFVLAIVYLHMRVHRTLMYRGTGEVYVDMRWIYV